jgi:hypothetical protein
VCVTQSVQVCLLQYLCRHLLLSELAYYPEQTECLSVCTCPFVCLSVCLCLCHTIRLSVRLSVCSCLYKSVRLSVGVTSVRMKKQNSIILNLHDLREFSKCPLKVEDLLQIGWTETLARNFFQVCIFLFFCVCVCN